MKTVAEVRRAFWAAHPSLLLQKKSIDTRCAFVDFVDYLARDGQITEALAFRATL